LHTIEKQLTTQGELTMKTTISPTPIKIPTALNNITYKLRLLTILPLICATLSSCAMNPGTTRAKEFSGGNGSAENPYQISDVSELYLMAHMVNDELLGDYYYVLTEDIYINDVENYDSWENNPPANQWESIGIGRASFTGGFDGGGHTIYGLYQTGELGDESCYGLFGDAWIATIENVSIEKAYIAVEKGGSKSGHDYGIGVLVDTAADAEVIDCSVSGVVTINNIETTANLIGREQQAYRHNGEQ